MLATDLQEYDASDVDARLVGGVAVLSLTTDKGRVVASMAPEVLERLALRIQLELASGGVPISTSGDQFVMAARRAVG